MDGSSEHDARLEVRGGRRLEGEVVLSGAKNSALKLLAASLLTTDPCVIRRVPRITDVATMVTMLRALGAVAETEGDGDVLSVHAGAGLTGCAPYELVRTMRASIIVMGPLVARFGEATVAMPGGCNIGPRRIDFHIRGLEKLGAHIDIDHGFDPRAQRRAHGRRGPARLPQRGRHREPRDGGHRRRGRDGHRERRPGAGDHGSLRLPARHGRRDRGRRLQYHPRRRRAGAARRRPRRDRRPHRGGHVPAHGRRHGWPGHDRRPGPGPSRAFPCQAARHGRAGG